MTQAMTYKKSLLPFVLALATLVTGCSGDKDALRQTKASEYLAHAENYRQRGQYKAAIIEIRNALQQDAENDSARLALAKIYNELGQGRATIELFSATTPLTRDQALTLTEGYLEQRKYYSALDLLRDNESRLNLSNDKTAIMLRARALIGSGDLDTAEVLLQQLDAKDIQVAIHLARIDWLRGNHDASKARLDALLQQHPENVEALSERARIAEHEGDLLKSEDLLSEALINLPQTDTLLPNKGEVLQRLMTTLTKLGRSNEALVYAKTLADANPEGNILQDKLNRGLEAFQAGNTDEAETLLAEVYQGSRNETVGTLLGMIRFSKNDLQGAAEYLATNVDPETADDAAMTALAATQLQLAQPGKLLEVFNAEERRRITSPELKALVGIALMQTGANAEGEKMLDTALRDNPGNSAIAIAAGRFYLQSKQPKKAIAALEAAAKNKPDVGLARLLIAAHLIVGQGDQALAIAQQLIKSAPDQADSWWVLGQTSLQLRKLEGADSALNKALQLNSEHAPARLALAQLQVLRKQPQQAVASYQTILKLHPASVSTLKGLVAALTAQERQPAIVEKNLLAIIDNETSRTVMADFYLQRNLYDEAKRLLASVPDNANNNYATSVKQAAALKGAALALEARDFETARKRIIEGLTLAPRSPELLIMLAHVEQKAGKLDEARKIADQLAAQQPQYPPLHELLGNLAMLEKKPAVAADHYRITWTAVANNDIATKLYQSLQHDPAAASRFLTEWQLRLPDSESPWLMRGLETQRAGNREAAVAAYTTALERNAESVEALNNLAWLYGEAKDSRALPLAEKAAELAPENPAVLDTYGWLLTQNGQRQKGIATLQKAASLAPQSAEIQAHLKEAGSPP